MNARTQVPFFETQRYSDAQIAAIRPFILAVATVVLLPLFVMLLLVGPEFPLGTLVDKLIVLGLFLAVLVLGITAFFRSAELQVHELPEGLDLRFRPLSHRLIPWSQVRSCTTRAYDPISERLGYGLSVSGGFIAYTVSGNQCVDLILADGRRVLIGTSQPAALAAAITAHMAR